MIWFGPSALSALRTSPQWGPHWLLCFQSSALLLLLGSGRIRLKALGSCHPQGVLAVGFSLAQLWLRLGSQLVNGKLIYYSAFHIHRSLKKEVLCVSLWSSLYWDQHGS